MKKNRCLYGGLALTILAGLLGIGNPALSVGKISYAQDVQAVSLANRSLTSYQVNYSKGLSETDAANLAVKLGIVAKPTGKLQQIDRATNGILSIPSQSDPAQLFNLDSKSGSLVFQAGLKEYQNQADSVNLVSAQKAPAAALKQLQQLGLKYNAKELKLVHVGGVNMATRQNNQTKVYQKFTTVRYDRILNGIPVMGATRIVVEMGANGKLTGLVYNWPEIVSSKVHKTAELCSDANVRSKIENHLLKVGANSDKINIKKSTLVLYDDGKGNIEPAYHVEATLNCNSTNLIDGKANSYETFYDYYVPVLANSKAQFPDQQVSGIVAPLNDSK